MKNNFTKALSAFVLAGVLATSASAQLNETFADRSLITSIVTTDATPLNDFFSDADTDYFGILDQAGSTDDFGAGTAPAGGTFTNADGNFLVAQDTDGDLPGNTTITITWTVDITGMADPYFAVSLAEDDDGSNEDWDDISSVQFSVVVDSNPSQNLIHVQSQSAGFNSAPAIDTNFNGTGDGTEITPDFTQFTADITGTGTTAVITLVIDNLKNGDEDIAIDNIIVQDGPFGPLPASFGSIYTSSNTTITVEFASPPASGGETVPGNWSLNDSSGAVINNVTGSNPYVLTFNGALSGDLIVDTLTFDNSTDAAIVGEVYGGPIPIADIRSAILADSNLNPDFGTAQVTVVAELIENVLDSFNNTDAFLDGIQITDVGNIDALTTVGANVIFSGTLNTNNGLARLEAGAGVVLTDSDTVLDATPIALGDVTALTTGTLEANEGKFVTVTNVVFDDAGSAIVIGGGGIDAGINNPDVIIRLDRDVEDEFELNELQGNAGSGNFPTGPGEITGIVGQFDTSDPRNSGYQILPLTAGDFNYPALVVVNPVLADAYTTNSIQVIAKFTVAPPAGGETTAGNWSVNDASGATVTSVSGSNPYTLTFDGPLSGDVTVDTLTFDNSTDAAATSDFYAGLLDLGVARAAILADGNLDPTFPAGIATVQAEVLEVTLDDNDTITLDGITIVDFSSGLASPGDISGAGALVTYAGQLASFNGLFQIDGNGSIGVLADDGDTVLDATPIALGDATALTTATLELNESRLVTITNIEFVDAGTAIPSGSTNLSIVGIADLQVRIDSDVDDAIRAAVLQAGRGAGDLPFGPGEITGIIGQFDSTDPKNSGYQIFPLLPGDFNYPLASSVDDWMMLNQD